MIDAKGYRPNVGIILTNDVGQVFWGRRVGQDAWQFPQGGINEGETVEEAMFRELHEEIGLKEHDVKILGQTHSWLRYRLPRRLVRNLSRPVCIGQKQKWFLLRLVSDAKAIELEASDKPEFDDWQWVNYWYPLHQVVPFKREVYRKALKELRVIIMPTVPVRPSLDLLCD